MAEHIGADEARRLREHSVLLNRVSWRLLEATGRVGPDDDRHEYDVSGAEMVDELVGRIDALTGELDTLRNAIRKHRESALCNGFMFVADRERDLWDALDALAVAGGGVPKEGA